MRIVNPLHDFLISVGDNQLFPSLSTMPVPYATGMHTQVCAVNGGVPQGRRYLPFVPVETPAIDLWPPLINEAWNPRNRSILSQADRSDIIDFLRNPCLVIKGDG